MRPQDRLEKLKQFFKQETTIREYIKDEKYDQIYTEFGSKAYSSHVPFTYKIDEITRLQESKKYNLILEKYGSKQYQKFLNSIIKEDILNETGDIHLANKYQIKHLAQNIAKSAVGFTKAAIIASTIFICGTPLLSEAVTAGIIKENAIEYQNEISIYNENAATYAEKIISLAKENNFSDLDIFMKVIYDMWESIEGYGQPQIDEIGFLRLDIQNKVGVCRNMADDIAYKLNEINPAYNARTLNIYLNTNGNCQIANIDIKFAKSAESEEIVNPDESTLINKTKIIGNHSVVLVDLNNITLLLDPTNPMIGVLKNGEIHLLNPHTGEVGYKNVTFGNSLMSGLDEYEYEIKLLTSFLNTYSLSELQEMYGIEAQNASLEKIQNIDKTTTLK